MGKSDNEDELLTRILKGDEMAFGVFFHDHYTTMAVLATTITGRWEDGQELGANGFIKLWQILKVNKDFNSLSALKGYLYTIVINDSRTFAKYKIKNSVSLESLPEIQAEEDDSAAREAWIMENYSLIYKALKSMNETQYKKILELHFKEGKSLKEIAALCQLTLNNVTKQKSVGLQRLAERAKEIYYIFQAGVIIWMIWKWISQQIVFIHLIIYIP